MKKSMIAAGAASLALAAMPVVGVFAADVTDTLQLTVNSVCSVSSMTPSTGTNTYTASAGTDAPVSFSADTATTFTVTCNSGYNITTAFTSLTGPSGSAPITYGGAATPTAGTWSAGYKLGSASTATQMTNNGTISGSASQSDVYTFEYKAHTAVDQMQGTYQGTAQYTLAAV